MQVVLQSPRFDRRVASSRSRKTEPAGRRGPLHYEHIFDQAIQRLHAEGRYRVFIDILRNKGAYPDARCFAGHNGPKPITVWCSNDYLAMGQHPEVIAAMEEAGIRVSPSPAELGTTLAEVLKG